MKENITTSLPFFYHKIKTRTYIEDLRHRSLNLDVINKWFKFHRNAARDNENIHVQKLNVNLFSKLGILLIF